VLGVSQQLLDEYGAVSAPVAEAMAEGVRRITGADFAVSVTGVAGPDRDDRGNEVGTVFIGIASDGIVTHEELQLDGDRAGIRNGAANAAFFLLLHAVQGKYPTT
jgi:PncC family amidohydrolase